MQTYEVTSDRCVIGPQGSTVSAEQLEGLNVEALVEAGHLTPSDPPAPAGTDPSTDPAPTAKGI